jgi:hypothetical protein
VATKFVGVLAEKALEHRDLVRCALIREPHEDDTPVLASIAEDFVSKVLVIRNHNAVFGDGALEDGIVRVASGIVIHREDIVPLTAKPRSHRRPSAFIDEESHLHGLQLQRQDFRLIQRFGSVQQAGLYIVRRQSSVLLENLLSGRTMGHEAQDVLDG